MTTTRLPVLLAVCCLALAGCRDDFEKNDKYARPDWLTGKVYTQLKDQPQLSTFASCLELTGYDTIVDRSGSYTIFAPDNGAFSAWLQEKGYGSVENIPREVLSGLVKYHIVQNPWTMAQLRSLDVYGWIDTLDLNNNKPRGFKRQTLLLENNRKMGVVQNRDRTFRIVDTLETGWHRIIATDSRKYAPVFFKEYFDIYNLSPSDYEFYFGRTIDSPQDIFYAGAKIIGEEIFAENGFVYEIDRVVDPLPNAFQLLERGSGSESYSEFLDLVNMFPEFEYNEDKTQDQPGAELGFEVDSLFDLTYPDLAFDILNERTTPPSGTFGLPGNVTIRYHHGMVAPTNTAFEQFLQEYFTGPTRWGNLDNAPVNIKRIVANTHLSSNPIYPSDMSGGYFNGEQDIIHIDQGTIIQAEYGSNSSFIGVDQTLVPRVFQSVAGPAYLLKGYSKTMYAIERAGLLSALKRADEDYLFFMESDANSAADSSLLHNPGTGVFSLYQIAAKREFVLSTSAIRTLLMNHIATGSVTGIPRKEFLPNLAGNYIIFDNVTGEVSGTAPTSAGYQGLVQIPNDPTLINMETDNGDTYDIANYFSFSAPSLYQKIQSTYPVFHSLILQSGLGNNFEYSFLSENEDYTIFIPTDSALNAYGADTLDTETLRSLIGLHFIQGSLIFTDGRSPSGYYETARIDEKSTTFTTVFTRIYLEPGADAISVRDTGGGTYVSAVESPSTNVMTGADLGEGTEIFRDLVITRVMHEIDRVLIFDEVDTN